jgi:hypothetical protein
MMPRTSQLELPQHLTLEEIEQRCIRFRLLLTAGRFDHIRGMVDEAEGMCIERMRPRQMDPRRVQIAELSREEGFVNLVNSLEDAGIFNCGAAIDSTAEELMAMPNFGTKKLDAIRSLLRARFPRSKGRIFEGGE